MNKILKQLIAKAFIFFGLVDRQYRRSRNENLITSIYFHNPSKELFESCINWLVDKKYHFISTEQLYRLLNENENIKNGAVCITVDDGYKENIKNIIPIIKKHKIPITIFVAIEPCENGVFWWSYIYKYNKQSRKKISLDTIKMLPNNQRLELLNRIKAKIKLPREAMTKKDIIEISKIEEVTIGNHTVNHPITSKCDLQELNYEISEASNKLNSWIGNDVSFFSYPNGDYDGREEEFLRDNKIKLAFTTNPNFINLKAANNRFEVPRFSVNDNGSFAENVCKMVGVWQKLIK